MLFCSVEVVMARPSISPRRNASSVSVLAR
jgi:hypothetical protein